MNKLTNLALWWVLASSINTQAEMKLILTDMDFKGSIVVQETCTDVFKAIEFGNSYWIESFRKDSKGNYNLNIKPITFKTLSKNSDKVEKILCKNRK